MSALVGFLVALLGAALLVWAAQVSSDDLFIAGGFTLLVGLWKAADL